MEEEFERLWEARTQYYEAARTAHRMRELTCLEAEEQYNRFLQPFRKAYYDAIEAAGKEVPA